MPDLLLIVLGTVLVNHFVLGGSAFKPASDDLASTSKTVALSTGAVMLVTAALATSLQRWLLLPLSAGYLYLLVVVATSGGASWLFSLYVERPGTTSHKPLVMSNGIVLTLALQHAATGHEWLAASVIAVSLAIAFVILLPGFTELLLRIEQLDVPRPFRGEPIALMTAGLAALALLGLAGLLPD